MINNYLFLFMYDIGLSLGKLIDLELNSIFPGINEIEKIATDSDVNNFISNSFISLATKFNSKFTTNVLATSYFKSDAEMKAQMELCDRIW